MVAPEITRAYRATADVVSRPVKNITKADSSDDDDANLAHRAKVCSAKVPKALKLRTNETNGLL